MVFGFFEEASSSSACSTESRRDFFAVEDGPELGDLDGFRFCALFHVCRLSFALVCGNVFEERVSVSWDQLVRY